MNLDLFPVDNAPGGPSGASVDPPRGQGTPCPFCGAWRGTWIGSEIARLAFGDGRCHVQCLEEVLEMLRSTGKNPAEWPEILRQYAIESLHSASIAEPSTDVATDPTVI
jgi:hypothetical protein